MRRPPCTQRISLSGEKLKRSRGNSGGGWLLDISLHRRLAEATRMRTILQASLDHLTKCSWLREFQRLSSRLIIQEVTRFVCLTHTLGPNQNTGKKIDQTHHLRYIYMLSGSRGVHDVVVQGRQRTCRQ